MLQTLSQGTESIKSLITEILVDEFAPRAVIERNDARVRLLEGLPWFPAHSTAALPKSLKFCSTAYGSLLRLLADRRRARFSINVRIGWRHALLHRHQIVERALTCFTFNGRSRFILPVCVVRLSESIFLRMLLVVPHETPR